MVLAKRRAKEIEEETENYQPPKKKKVSFKQVVSTGSTLLDLAISGKRIRGGGIPGGILVEIFGQEASGKSAILASIAASTQVRGGEVMFLDPESRLDKEYARIYGVKLGAKNYHRPETVTEVFDKMRTWEVKNPNVINLMATDSLAALASEMEMSDKGDKRGQARAKDFSSELRRSARIMSNKNLLMVCSNQVREGDYGEVTPGGRAIRFYASLRIRVSQTGMIERKAKLKNGKVIEKVTGINTHCYIKKSVVDDPYRECDLKIVFNYGLDNTSANLQYIKDMTKATTYIVGKKSYKSCNQAAIYVEENGMEQELCDKVIDLWEEAEDRFSTNRRPKIVW